MGCLNSKPSEEREKGEKDIVLDIKLLLLGNFFFPIEFFF